MLIIARTLRVRTERRRAHYGHHEDEEWHYKRGSDTTKGEDATAVDHGICCQDTGN